jgi:hypothetical protein
MTDRRDEYAAPLEIDLMWGQGAEEPVLLKGPGRSFLLFWLAPIDPSGRPLGVIEWCRPRVSYIGSPNDEARNGHRLWEHGLGAGPAYEVFNSSWIADMEMRNRVHPRHTPERFESLRHFILIFQDATVECIADGFRTMSTDGPRINVVRELGARAVDTRWVPDEPVAF